MKLTREEKQVILDQPAFPVVIDDASKNQFSATGMSMREYFAAMALSGILARSSPGNIREVSEAAVMYADATILKLRETN